MAAVFADDGDYIAGNKPQRNETQKRLLHDGGEVPGQGSGLLGARYAPGFVPGDPTQADFSIDTLRLPGDVSRRRFQEARS